MLRLCGPNEIALDHNKGNSLDAACVQAANLYIAIGNGTMQGLKAGRSAGSVAIHRY